jgi:hypothetical protein
VVYEYACAWHSVESVAPSPTEEILSLSALSTKPPVKDHCTWLLELSVTTDFTKNVATAPPAAWATGVVE